MRPCGTDIGNELFSRRESPASSNRAANGPDRAGSTVELLGEG
jgi:hypothetical protein